LIRASVRRKQSGQMVIYIVRILGGGDETAATAAGVENDMA
jgi:hypothetical protein